ncbi:hypothetical protein K2X30_08275 [bacterium]|nr:hypothetical protein [bacterium]
MRQIPLSLLTVLTSSIIVGCSSTPPVKAQAYANLKDEKTFEYEFPMVWKGIEATLRNYKIAERDPEEVEPLEMQKIKKRTLQTDWIYGQSRDKYQEYKINGTPRKQYLQTRVKYEVIASRVMGGVNVKIITQEEIEKLNSDGSSDGYSKASSPDPSRAAEMIDKIGNSILSLPP